MIKKDITTEQIRERLDALTAKYQFKWNELFVNDLEKNAASRIAIKLWTYKDDDKFKIDMMCNFDSDSYILRHVPAFIATSYWFVLKYNDKIIDSSGVYLIFRSNLSFDDDDDGFLSASALMNAIDQTLLDLSDVIESLYLKNNPITRTTTLEDVLSDFDSIDFNEL